MLLLDLDPNVVKPGWIPLIITLLLALALVLLYRSMRRQFRKIKIDGEETDVAQSESADPADSDSPSASAN